MKNPIFDIENWREIGTTLAQNKTRTFMTAFGIFGHGHTRHAHRRFERPEEFHGT